MPQPARQGKFIYMAHFSNKAIQSASHKTPKTLRQNAKERHHKKDTQIQLKTVNLNCNEPRE